MIDEISRVVKSGGVVDVLEYDFQAYDENKTRIASDFKGWSHYLAIARDAIKKRGGSPEVNQIALLVHVAEPNELGRRTSSFSYRETRCLQGCRLSATLGSDVPSD